MKERNRTGMTTAAQASPELRFLISGIDTIQCCYYLAPCRETKIDFADLRAQRESLRDVRDPEPKPLPIGGMEFLLAPYGSLLGYPIVLSNADFRIECGEFNNPPFYVTYRSEALWRERYEALHERFLDWARGVGFEPAPPETLSRVDFCSDYYLPTLDFDEDSFVSLAQKDSQHRANGEVQTCTFGRDDVVLRVYDKVAEINEASGKTWLFSIWGRKEDVWRVEWQVRKGMLRRFGIRTYRDLHDQAGDLLHYLTTEHTTLRTKASDSSRSRWPLHPMWRDLRAQIDSFNVQGIYRCIDPNRRLEERIWRIVQGVNGNLKQLAALRCVQCGERSMSHEEARDELQTLLRKFDDPLSWRIDVEKRVKFIQLGQ